MEGKWQRGDELRCLRCDEPLDLLGTREFHEGTRWGVLGEVAELFVNKERYDVMVCPICWHLEFFIGGVVGERPVGAEPARRSGEPFSRE